MENRKNNLMGGDRPGLRLLWAAPAVGLALLAGCHKETVPPETPPLVSVAPVERYTGEASSTRYSASTVANTQVNLAFKSGGYVTGILQVRGSDGRMRDVQGGDRVRQGSVLAQVRRADYANPVDQSRAGVTQTQANVKTATAQIQEARSQQSTAESNLAEALAGQEQARAQLSQAEANERQAAAAEKQAESNLADARAGLKGAEAQLAGTEVALKEAQAQLAESQAGLEEARSNLVARQARQVETKQTFDRAVVLYRKQSMTKPDYDQATANYDVAKADVITSQAQIAQLAATVRKSREAVAEAQTKIDGARAQVASAQAKVQAAQAQVAQSEAALKGAQAAVKNAQAGVQGAAAKVASAKTQINTAKAGVIVAESQREGARAAVGGAKAQLASQQLPLHDAQLRAPMNAVVVQRQTEIGNFVQPGATGFTLADMTRVKAIFGVPDVSLHLVKLGATQTLTAEALPGKRFRGTITGIAPSADPKNRVYQVEVTVPNPDQELGLNMIVTLNLPGGKLDHPVEVIPVGGVVRPPGGEQGYAVFVAADEAGKPVARLRRVQLGQAFGNVIAVEGGLQPGDQVIVAGAGLGLRDGQPIQVKPPKE